MRALTNIPLQFQAATKNHLGRVLQRLENHPTPSISEEEGGDQVSQQERHLVVKFTSSKHDRPQDFKVDLGLFKLYPALGYCQAQLQLQLQLQLELRLALIS